MAESVMDKFEFRPRGVSFTRSVTSITTARDPSARIHFFLDAADCPPYRGCSSGLAPEPSRISCRVAEGNGPAEATTTGSGNSLIAWCQFPPGSRGT
jgi:hypothetical protein